MNDVNSREFKRKYVKCKLAVRRWENEFLAKNGRCPTKADIKASPSIKEQYKLYWKLKTQFLEAEILQDDDLNEEIPHLSRHQSDSVLEEYRNTIQDDRKKNESNSCSVGVAEGDKCVTEYEKTDAEVWGSHLNRTETVSVIQKEKLTILSETIAGRLFKGSSFKKRNPRKSLSFCKKSNKSLNSEEMKSVDFPDITFIMSPYSDGPNDVGDQSSNGSLFSVENDCSPNIKALITSSASLVPLLNKPQQCKGVTVQEEDQAMVSVQPVSLIQAVALDPSVVLKPSRSLNAGWVERCTQVCGEAKEERKSSDSGFESLEFSQVLEESKVKESSHDDDDLIVESDNELDENSRLTCSFISQKRKSECSPVQETPPNGTNFGGVITPVPGINAQRPWKKTKVDVVVEKVKLKTKEESKETILEKKMLAGRLNENFLKIDLKKKVFVRGKKTFNFARYKKREWKNKKKALNDEIVDCSGGIVECYRCGKPGHFARHCSKAAEDKLLEDDDYESDDELPTLEEAEKMAKEKTEENNFKKRNVLTFEQPQPPEDNLVRRVEPMYREVEVEERRTAEEIPPEVYEALNKFGHSEFRPGQLETIMRILRGRSTLLTIATGGGKSLCYQLPAYLYASKSKCITLVVSPLVSLMEDQVSGSSSFFKVGCLHTGQTQKQRETVIEDAKNGKLYALLLSPEAVVSGDFSGFGNIFRQLPPIAFACIDEVHCISQWSHNFRPSYLMISKVLKEKLGVTTVLGLTATATVSTIDGITRELGICPNSGVIKDIPLPDNLLLSVSREQNKDEALIGLLKSARFKDANAILIYCTRRDECERLAVYIRTCLQDPAVRSGRSSRSLSWNAESYHAGMAAGRRRQVQKAFMRGNLRIVVATVAFGMGINKQDIRGVIHYNMPKDLESYVQEVGRAGRDGFPAYCHLFLDSKGRDLFELRRHVHSNSVDRHVLRKLLHWVFRECGCREREEACRGHEVGFNCGEAVHVLDIPEENIYTLLSYLELNEKKFIKVLAPVYMKCRIKSYKGIKEIISAAKKCPPLAYAFALRSKSEKGEVVEFDVIEIADRLGWDSGVVKSQLKSLEWEMSNDKKRRKTGMAVEFFELGFRVCSRGDMTPSELDEALNYLVQRVESQEKRSLAQLDITFSTFNHFGKENYGCCLEDVDEGTSKELKHAIRKYFEREELCSEIPKIEFQIASFDEEAVAVDVRTLVCTYRDNTFNGRAVARIFHGIQSPNYPASIWYKCKFWRKHVDKDFNKISRLAATEILRLRI